MKIKKIAITGGIGSGKSTVSAYLKEKGFPVFSCDEIYKDILEMPHYISQLQTIFPSTIINGKLDKIALSKIVFSDNNAREKLNQLAHPLIMKTLFEKMNEQSSKFVFAEVPLLFEENYESQFDDVIVIKREKEKRILATQQRDKAKRGDIKKRIDSQFDYDSTNGKIRIKNCNAYIIENNEGLEILKEKIEKLLLLL